MAEWRNASGFDKGLAYPYTTIYNNDATTEWQVDRCPYTVPGMLLWLRNGAQDFDYTLYNSLYDPPSYGPKHALLIVDSHYWPLEWQEMGTSEAHLRLNSRCQPGNATFTRQRTTPFTVRRSDAAGNILETKTFKSLSAVSHVQRRTGLLSRSEVQACERRAVLLGCSSQPGGTRPGPLHDPDHVGGQDPGHGSLRDRPRRYHPRLRQSG